MRIKLDSSIDVMSPGFGAYIKNNQLYLPIAIISLVAATGSNEVHIAMAYLAAFPSSVAAHLGIEVDEAILEISRVRTLVNNYGTDTSFLDDPPPEYPTGAVPKYS